LVLASSSLYRRALLERLGIAFDVARPDVAETAVPDESPPGRAERLALAKARAVAETFPNATVIGSDQVAALGDLVLDKPGNAATCRSQLAILSGATAAFFTACAVISPDPKQVLSHLDTTTVTFRRLQAQEIERYIERERPFDCAGGFKAEALGIALFEQIETADPTALIGLPLIWLSSALRQLGYRVP
jgi:septum formation protein